MLEGDDDDGKSMLARVQWRDGAAVCDGDGGWQCSRCYVRLLMAMMVAGQWLWLLTETIGVTSTPLCSNPLSCFLSNGFESLARLEASSTLGLLDDGRVGLGQWAHALGMARDCWNRDLVMWFWILIAFGGWFDGFYALGEGD